MTLLREQRTKDKIVQGHKMNKLLLSLKDSSDKMTTNDMLLYFDQFFVQPLTEMFPPAARRNKYRDA